MLQELNVEPIARFCAYHVSGLEPRIMGVGPIHAVPKVLQRAGLTANDIDLYELNKRLSLLKALQSLVS